MLDAELINDSSMSFSGYDDDDDDDDDDKDEDEDEYADEDADDDEAVSNTASVLHNASADEVDAYRGMFAEVMQKLGDNGIDIDEIAEDAGVSTSDIDALSHDDLVTLTDYVNQNHPEVLQSVSGRFPTAQGILTALTGGDSLGGFFRKLY